MPQFTVPTTEPLIQRCGLLMWSSSKSVQYCWPAFVLVSVMLSAACTLSGQLQEQLLDSLCCGQSALRYSLRSLHKSLIRQILFVSCSAPFFFLSSLLCRVRRHHVYLCLLSTAQHIILSLSSPQDLDHCVALVLQIPFRWLCGAPSRQPPAFALPRGPDRLLRPQPAAQPVQAHQPAAEPPRAQGVALVPPQPPQQGAVPRHHPLHQQDRYLLGFSVSCW